MRCILTNKTIGITLFSIGHGTNDSYHWYQLTIGIALYPARPHEKII